MNQLKIKIALLLNNIWQRKHAVFNSSTILRKEKPFQNLVVNFTNSTINESIKYDNNEYFHIESIGELRGCYIDPDYAYCVAFPNIFYVNTAFYPNLSPSFFRFIKSLFKRVKSIEECVIFDGQVGKNYFHFFSDVLSKIWLIRKNKLDHLPLLIHREVYLTPHFQFFLNKSNLFNGLNWVILDYNFIKVKRVHLLRSMPYEYRYFNEIRKAVHEVIPMVKQTSKRIFLTRLKKNGRTISNWEEIEKIIAKYNFEVVETSNMAFEAQIKLFSEAEMLISIHGAGNVNIIFSEKNLKFLEICPENRICSHYYWLANTLKIKYYDMVLGGHLSNKGRYPEGDFYLDPLELERAVCHMVHEN